ncbi:MAG: HAMP domain-containing histidine kinase [Labilithrix sp.]|nr:HAMP domain-containing histidine kinase [Labilithrix sp.]MCW5816798.1 HAMP domain-containing histidine kinase [Labilithrix sp.]
MTFRVRTALVVLVLTALTMGGAFATVWHLFVSTQRAQLDRALLVVAENEAREATAGSLDFTDAPGPSANAVGPLPKYGVIYAAGGRPVSTTANLTAESAPPMPRLVRFGEGFDFEHDGRPMRGITVPVGGTAMRVLLATTRDDLEEDSMILRHAMSVAFVVGCVWAAVVAFGVATRLTREHSAVGAVARRVASGDTSARVAFASSNADMQQLADDLNAMIERLVGLLSVQERFIANAAHELRTPLTSLRIELELALRRGTTREDYEGALRGALDSARRLTGLAEDLLQLARMKAAAPVKGEAAIEDAVLDAVGDVAPVGRARHVFIVVEPFHALVAGDRAGIARLLRNLLENAVRFSPDEGRVRVAAAEKDGRLEISVSDDGPGIAKEDEDRIFEPFARGARGREPNGTGLGLSIARELARSYGGDVRAVPSEEGGRFVIALRLREAPPEDEAAEPALAAAT